MTFAFLFKVVLNVILFLNSFYNTVLSYKKASLFNLLFQSRPEDQSASLPGPG